ncbi:MAG: hypothetical protein HRT67_00625 [Flavobacteriaceae bacterium]|nr:hypothetical protein [Flavobacteriaceae bacterium]
MSKDLKHIKTSGFKVPEDYFEALEDHIIANSSLDTRISEAKTLGFRVPKDYFETLEDSIFSKLETCEETKVLPLFKKRNILSFSSIAAAFLIMLAFFVNSDYEEFDYFLAENYIIDKDVDVYELAALLTDEELNNIQTTVRNSTYTEDDMESYLLDHINLEDLIE